MAAAHEGGELGHDPGRSCADEATRDTHVGTGGVQGAAPRGCTHRDHRVERAVGDRRRIAVQAVQSRSRSPPTRGMKPERATIASRARAARAEAERPAHCRPLREASEHDGCGQPVEEPPSATKLGQKVSGPAWGSRRAGTSGRRRAAARAARGSDAVQPALGVERVEERVRSYSSAPRPCSRTSDPCGSPAAGRSRT